MISAVVKLTWVEVKLFVREPLTVAFSLAFPLILLFVLAEVFGNERSEDVYRGVGPIDFYLPAYMALAMAAVGFISIPTHLASYRESGVLRRFRASAVPSWSLFGSQVVVAFLLSALSSAVMIAFVVLVYEPGAPSDIPGVVAAYILGALTLAALGLFLGSVLPSPRSAQLAGMILFFVMMIISGPGPPREVLPTTLQTVGDTMPLTHIVTFLQDPWLGFGWNYGEMGVVLGMLVLSAGLSWTLFRWE